VFIKVEENTLNLKYISNAQENIQKNSDILFEISTTIKLPAKWFSDITINPVNKGLILTFFTMGQYNENYERIVEKQLVLTSGILNGLLFYQFYILICGLMKINECIYFTALDIIMHVLNKQLSNNEPQMFYPTVPLPIVSTNVISSIINMFNTVKVCYGAAPVSKYPDIKPSFECQIINSNWKHHNCSKILVDNNV